VIYSSCFTTSGLSSGHRLPDPVIFAIQKNPKKNSKVSMLLLDQVVERSSSPISECPPDDEVGTLRSNDSDDRLSNPACNNDGSPVSIFKSRMRQKDSGVSIRKEPLAQYVSVSDFVVNTLF
jgi:hypothetical protein